jgi:EAL domain-containing protein (putative c-di-GMP-specific phosphodiesterase class I)
VARLSFSIGPLAAGLTNAKTPPPLAEARGFTRIAELALRQDAPGGLGLVEVKGWQSVRENLSGEDRVALENSIGDVLCQSGQASTASGIADGRYGVITTSTIDMAKMLARLEATLRASPAARHATVEGAQIPFTASDIPKPQAARALRYALGQFAGGGIDAARMAGAADGLAGIIASAQTHAVAVRQTLEERRFRLLYQPVVSLSDRSIHHFEALLRPNPGPGLPFQAPQDFVTFAEALGLSELLDWAVLETAILALSENADVCVAVNMSGLSMQNPAYRKRLLNRLADLRAEGGKLDPSRLMIELTETAEIEDLDAAAATMEQLRSVGVPVCLDDFGAGVAVFRYLRAFGVDHVKLDGDYVRAACKTKRDRLLVASMVELAGTAGACVTAEMIETEEQLRAMQDMGVQFGQGWLFGRPGLLPGSR